MAEVVRRMTSPRSHHPALPFQTTTDRVCVAHQAGIYEVRRISFWMRLIHSRPCAGNRNPESL